MPLLVRNLASDTALFAKKGQPTVTWGPAGQLDDVKRVPNEWADDIDFLESVDAGILEVVEDGSSPEIVAQMQAARGSFRAAQQASAARVSATLDRRQDRDIIGEKCIGPGERTGQQCGAAVLIKASQRNEVPPLCSRHENLSTDFYLSESGSKGEGPAAAEGREGEVKRTWRRTEVGPRMRG